MTPMPPLLWRAAWALGTCSEEDAVNVDGILPALSGRRNWASPAIDIVGLLGGPAKSVTEALTWATAVAPTLNLEVHCAEQWGQSRCEVTLVVEGGLVIAEPPKVRQLRERTEDEEFDWILVAAQLLS